MIFSGLPSNEELRQQELESLELLDTPPEKEFDDIIELAAQICNCPVSFLSLLDKDRQWFKAVKGLDAAETRRDISFCSHTILQEEVMVVEDALLDARFADSPLVTGETKMRFYAGTPVYSPSGQPLGAVCVVDHKPNTLSAAQRQSLVLMAKQVTHLLTLRKQNLLIRKKAEEMLELKSLAIRENIRQQEIEKQHIARELHENLAQTVAASNINLNIALSNADKRLSLVEDSQAQLRDVLGTMRTLSYSINPSGYGIIPVDLLFQDIVLKEKPTLPFSLELRCHQTLPLSEPEQSISLVRILEQWLQLIRKKKGVTAAWIHLSLQDKLHLLLEENGAATGAAEMERQLVKSLLYDRIRGMQGQVDYQETSGSNYLSIHLPFRKR